jgi:hypothetical protein
VEEGLDVQRIGALKAEGARLDEASVAALALAEAGAGQRPL